MVYLLQFMTEIKILLLHHMLENLVALYYKIIKWLPNASQSGSQAGSTL